MAEKKRTRLAFSDGWLSAFKKCWGLLEFCSHGTSDDCDDGAVASKVSKMHEKLKNYAVQDTFDADEFGLSYRMAPTKTIAAERMPDWRI